LCTNFICSCVEKYISNGRGIIAENLCNHTASSLNGKEQGMTKRDFDKLSMDWDREPRRQRLSADIASGIQEMIPLTPEMHLLDYGCGTGLVAMHLLPRVGRITGMDSSPGMLSVFAGKLSAMDQQRVHLETLDLADGGQFSGCFDVIIAAMLLHHVENPLELIQRLASHLSPGGYLCLADLDSEDGSFHDDPTGIFHHGFHRREVTSWLAAAGLAPCGEATVSTIEKTSSSAAVRRYSLFLLAARRQ
jgi:2-polyprenyl-3-methyl-5-hydroxy-6-metoxy-1,4-benzoquinol methylase